MFPVHHSPKYKVFFVIQKKVDFGMGVYVVGNIDALGNWDVKDSLRLSWNKDNYWTGLLTVENHQLGPIINFKYVVAQWENPENGQIIWQIGKNNRKINLSLEKHHIICDNVWSKEKITLNLLMASQGKNDGLYVIGNCTELGSWQTPKKLTHVQLTQTTISEAKLKSKQSNLTKCYQISILVPRGMKKLHYYYIKKSTYCEVQRHPGRYYQVQLNKNYHPRCFDIQQNSTNTEIFQICDFNELNYSKINPNIYLGAYIRDAEDIKKLKSDGVTSILSIQTQEDFESHNISLEYFKKICQYFEISHQLVDIEDMNKRDFVDKAAKAVRIMKKIIQKGQTVYIHCSAGVYRSSQLVVLYLILTQNISISEAIYKVKLRHPFARPNQSVVNESLIRLIKTPKLIKLFQ